MATPEAKASLIVCLRANKLGCRLLRNNTGVAYDQHERPIFFGLGNTGKKKIGDDRTPDWVGWHNTVITQEMVGKTLPVFTAIDAKKAGFKNKEKWPVRSTEHGQNEFFKKVIKANGLAGFASCDEQVDNLVEEFYQRVTKC